MEKSRREVLSGVACVAGSLTTVGTAEGSRRAKQEERDTYETLMNERDAFDLDTGTFQRALADSGFTVVTSTTTALTLTDDGRSIDRVDSTSWSGPENAFTAQSYPEADLTFTTSLYEGGYNSLADTEWSVSTGFLETGSPPMDNITAGWSDKQYLYDGEYHDTQDGYTSLRQRGAEGAVWGWQDPYELGTSSAGNMYGEGFATAYLDPQGDCNTRRVYFTFEHTWRDISLTGANFGGGGVSLFYSDDTYLWKQRNDEEFGGTC